MFGVDTTTIILIVGCLLLVGAFEFVNGFHDSANAVAPVIYTNSLKPRVAILISAAMNFLWVIIGGIGVAMGILHLLPLEVISTQSLGFGLSIIFSLLLSAIIWNLGTWYLGLPASSSHTMIGSILGITMVLWLSQWVEIPTHKAQEVFESLLFSPILGFALAFGLMIVFHHIANRWFFARPTGPRSHPTGAIRFGLIASSAFVSFAHGSNDGQKWVGLALLVLLTLAPWVFAINPAFDQIGLRTQVSTLEQSLASLDMTHLSLSSQTTLQTMRGQTSELSTLLEKSRLEPTDRIEIRRDILSLQKSYSQIAPANGVIPSATAGSVGGSVSGLQTTIASLSTGTTDYAPWWIIGFISLCLGLGTMIGWRRIVITIGEKIGKEKLNYAQATTASLVTATTIWLASYIGLPVSTTHVMSSGVAGTMSAEHGSGGLQWATIRNIALAWILTLPVSLLLSAGLFSLFIRVLG